MDEGDTAAHWRYYELALEEVRGQVDRGWSYTQFFILLNAGIVGAVLALLGEHANRWVAVGALGAGAVLCAAGVLVLRQNKTYYRLLAAKRAAVEHVLGLDQKIPGSETTYALTPTASEEKLQRMARQPTAYAQARIRLGSLTDVARWTLVALGCFDVATAAALAFGWL